MLIYKTNFIPKVKLSFSEETTIIFGEDFELTIASQKNSFGICSFNVANVKGDFVISKITATLFYNASTKHFSPCFLGNGEYTFYISANIPMKELCAVNYQLFVPVSRLRLLKLYHYFKDELVLPGYDGMKFVYYVKKIKKNESDGCDIEIHVENRRNVEIEGKGGDYKVEQCGTKDINIPLSFVFYPSALAKPLLTPNAETKPDIIPAIDESSTTKFDTDKSCKSAADAITFADKTDLNLVAKQLIDFSLKNGGDNPSDAKNLFSFTSTPASEQGHQTSLFPDFNKTTPRVQNSQQLLPNLFSSVAKPSPLTFNNTTNGFKFDTKSSTTFSSTQTSANNIGSRNSTTTAASSKPETSGTSAKLTSDSAPASGIPALPSNETKDVPPML
uniref:Arrestin-like N-terminal domain-containing protein n=1 Tax=Panagrolaimus davidi TaxID=227884 RepID=A0A914P8J6_9BILA